MAEKREDAVSFDKELLAESRKATDNQSGGSSGIEPKSGIVASFS